MKLISTDEVIEKANAKFSASMKSAMEGLPVPFDLPMPSSIENLQVLAVTEALVEEVNARLAALAGWEA